MILENEIALGGTPPPAAYQIERSLRFNSPDTASLSWTPAQAGNRKTWTWSAWVKRTTLGDQYVFEVPDGGTTGFHIRFNATDQLRINDYIVGTDYTYLVSSAVYRDVSAWYHIVVAFDTTQATNTNRVKVYVNGAQVTAFSTSTYPSQNQDTAVSSLKQHQYSTGNKYLAEAHFIDGLALDPTSFGETSTSTGVWTPKAYTGSYGQNGFYLPFNDNSTVLNLGRNRQTLTADPYFPVTTLLLNGNGTNGAQNNTFLDSSSNNFTITRNGNTTQGTFSPFSQTGWGNYFNGSSDYLSFSDNAAFEFGSGDFTLEAWVNFSALPAANGHQATLFSKWGGATTQAYEFYLYNNAGTQQLYFTYSLNSTSATNTGGVNWTPTVGVWYHLACVRSGSNVYFFVNGTQQGSTGSISGAIADNASTLQIGSFNNSANTFLNGYISNARITKGGALYTSAFTPSTTALTTTVSAGTVSLLTCQSNRFLDNSSNAFAITVNGSPSVQAFSPFAPTAAYSAATNGGSGYFDGSGDYLSSTISALSGTFTLEFWFYRPSSGNNFCFTIGDSQTGGNTSAEVYIGTSGTVLNYWANNAAQITGTPAPAGQWVYLAVTRDASNVVRLYQNGTQVGGTYTQSGTLSTALRIGTEWYGGASTGTTNGYIGHFRVSNSVRTVTAVPTSPFASDANTVFLANFTNAGILDSTGKNALETVGNAQISTTVSKWGGGSLAFDGTGDWLLLPNSPVHNLQSSDFTIEFWMYLNSSADQNVIAKWWTGGSQWVVQFRAAGSDGRGSAHIRFAWNASNTADFDFTMPTGTWMHIALVRSGTTLSCYKDGVKNATTATVGSITATTDVLSIGQFANTSANALNGNLDDVRITNYARYTGNFSVPTAQFAYDTADINVKQWVPNNFSVTAGVGNDSLVDSPTNYGTDTGAGGEVRGNYATLNPLNNIRGSNGSLSNGNLDNVGGASPAKAFPSTIAVTSGKYYAEFVAVAKAYVQVGAADALLFPYGSGQVYGSGAITYDLFNGSYFINSTTGTGGVATADGDVIMVAIDADTRKIWFGKNGVWNGSGAPASGTNQIGVLAGTDAIQFFARAEGTTVSANFGQRPFAYTAPSGFKALNTQNLLTPAIGASASTLASKNFNIALWTGNASARTISGVGFQPSLVWSKSRSQASNNVLNDIVRGAGLTLQSDLTAAEVNEGTAGLTSFTSDGFTIGGASGGWNTNAQTYVGWNWNAGTSSVTNTSGTITSTVRANPAAGISVVGYTGNGAVGATIGHGLGVAPKMVIVKNRTDASTFWNSYHASLGNGSAVDLNTTAAAAASAFYWNNTSPTANVFTVSTNGTGYTNVSGKSYIAYCFAEVAGFSKFGSYTGNGSADGPFVFTGFRPRYVMAKRSDAGAENWIVIDTARNTFNVSDELLKPNLSNAVEIYSQLDILSNGFKVRNTGTGMNASGGTYIFAAFAEAPFNYSRAR